MNEVFLIGKIITNIEFKFIINSKKRKSIVKFEIESLNKQIIRIIAYNEMADLCYRKLHMGDNVFIIGKLNNDGFVNICNFTKSFK